MCYNYVRVNLTSYYLLFYNIWTILSLLDYVMQMNEKMTSALKATSSGDQSALNKVADVISDSLHAAVIMLKVCDWLIRVAT